MPCVWQLFYFEMSHRTCFSYVTYIWEAAPAHAGAERPSEAHPCVPRVHSAALTRHVAPRTSGPVSAPPVLHKRPQGYAGQGGERIAGAPAVDAEPPNPSRFSNWMFYYLNSPSCRTTKQYTLIKRVNSCCSHVLQEKKKHLRKLNSVGEKWSVYDSSWRRAFIAHNACWHRT